jgi:hypothetical protein
MFVLRLTAPGIAKAAGTLPVACAWCAPHPCKRPGSVPTAQQTATDRAGERVVEREKERGRGIKYRIVGIEYVIEITGMRKK